MEVKEQFRIIQAVLNEVASRESCYPDGAVAEEIIEKVRNLTGNASFCRDVPPVSDLLAKGGYELRIETWENDADNYKTQVLTNLTEEDLDFYIELAHLFSSTNSREDPGMGNEEHDFEVYAEIMHDIFVDHWEKLSTDTKEVWGLTSAESTDEDSRGRAYYERLIKHVLGYPVDYDYGFARVFDNLKVFTVEDGRRVEVTDKFK
jgi:hypothetical protein